MNTPFVALHGAFMQGSSLQTLAAALGRAAITPGLPAHRRGLAWDPGRDYHDQALEGLIAALPEGPVDLFGHSLGATVALRLAVEQPDRVRSLVLFEPVLFAAAHPEARDRHAAEMAPFHKALEEGLEGSAAAHFHGLWGGGDRWEDLPDLARRAMLRLLPIIEASAPGIFEDRPGVVPRLADCRVPTLVLHQNQPPEIVAAISSGLRRMPLVEVRAVAGPGGHMLPLTAPQAVAAEISAFWAALPANNARSLSTS